MKFKIYAAGGFTDAWQNKIKVLFPEFEILDPRTWQHPLPEIYTQRDLQAIRNSDLVLAYMNSANPSGYGVSIEIGYAYGIGKHIVFLDMLDVDWRSKYFGMARSMANAVFYDFDSCEQYIKDFYLKTKLYEQAQ